MSVSNIPGKVTVLVFALIVSVSSTFSSWAQERMTKEQVETIVREYLLKNPEIILEVQDALTRKQEGELADRQLATIRQNAEVLFSSPHQIEFGPENAEITIVEFFDYNCGFCQRAMADMQQILRDDKNVRFVLKEFPVLGEQSIEASRVSLAMSKLMPDKYGKFHINLLGLPGLKNGENAIRTALNLGVNEDALRAEMEKPYIIDAMREVYELADGLGISGTPSYVVGEKVVFGAVGYDQLKEELNSQLQQ